MIRRTSPKVSWISVLKMTCWLLLGSWRVGIEMTLEDDWERNACKGVELIRGFWCISTGVEKCWGENKVKSGEKRCKSEDAIFHADKTARTQKSWHTPFLAHTPRIELQVCGPLFVFHSTSPSLLLIPFVRQYHPLRFVLAFRPSLLGTQESGLK